MRTNSHLAVGSPTVRVAAILAATMLLALSLAAAGVAGQQLLAAGGPIVVAQDGSGHYTSIAEAVAAAADGNEVLVQPGTYAEVVLVDKNISLRGDGPREEVILEFGSDGPTIDSYYGQVPYGLMLLDTEALVTDLTVSGPNVGAAIVFVGGAPTVERVTTELLGDFTGGPHTSVAVQNGAGGAIKDSLLDGPAWEINGFEMPEYADISGSGRFLVEDNVTDGGFGFDVTDGSVFQRNTVTNGAGLYPSLIGGGSVLIAENELATIELEEGSSDGFTIRDNIIRSGPEHLAGINLTPGAPTIEGNVFTGTGTGIVVPEGATPAITGNDFEGIRIGISVLGEETVAVIEGNRFCDNEQDLRVPEGSSLTLDTSNEVCAGPDSE